MGFKQNDYEAFNDRFEAVGPPGPPGPPVNQSSR